MSNGAVPARVLFLCSCLCSCLLLVTACNGGGSSEPPPATSAQAQAIAAAPGIEPRGGAFVSSDVAPDTGTLLPLEVLSPRSAGGITPMAITSCSSTAACTGGTNSSTGPGVAGVSSLGKGVTGTTKFASTSSSNGQYGVYGQDSSGSGSFDIGVYGISSRGIGVSGKSTSNYGVRGTSTNSAGVYGTGAAEGVYGNASSSGGIGVYGNSPSYIALYGVGVYGAYASGSSYGVLASSSGGYGGYFSSSGGIGARGTSSTNTGVYAFSGSGYAIEGHTNGSVGAYVTNGNGNGGDVTGSYIGLVARAPSGGFPLVATDSSGNDLFYVSGTGDVYYHGGLHMFATISGGAQAMAYSPQSTRPSVEDTGTAQLVGGRAVVMLDSTFARAIETGRPYQVFLTPGADTRGLYVASKTPSQFVVREVQGGHGTFSFDYHIYATAMGKGAQRMSIVRPNAKPIRFSPPANPSVKPPSKP